MKKLLLLIVLLNCFYSVSAQNRYVIKFTDKNNSSFSINNPIQFLSQRSINRRIHQHISINTNDLPVNSQYIQGVISTGATLLNTSKWFNAVMIETADPLVLDAINQLPYVITSVNIGKPSNNGNAVNKFRKEDISPFINNTTIQERMYGPDYGHSQNQATMLGLDFLHDNGFKGNGMIIAVIDGGFQDANLMHCFDSLFARNGIISTYDFVDHEVNVYNDHYHGAAVLSTMAANVPGEFIGTAPDAKYILLRSEDVNSEYIIEEYNWAVAAEYADSCGADVINSSLGYTAFDDTAQSHTYSDMDGNTCPSTIAADIAASKGMIVVVSAGNEGNHTWHYISSPTDGDSVLSVGAVDSLGQYAYFSSAGPSADGRVKPDVVAQGFNAWLYVPWSSEPVRANGTSFSGPIMAGAVTCLWQNWQSLNNMNILNAIRKSASQYTIPDSTLGYGIPNFSLAYNLLSLIDFEIPSNSPLHIFPNPWDGDSPLHALFYSDSSEKAVLTVTDMAGKIILRRDQIINGYGYTDIQLLLRISAGMYLLKIENSKGAFVKRFVRR